MVHTFISLKINCENFRDTFTLYIEACQVYLFLTSRPTFVYDLNSQYAISATWGPSVKTMKTKALVWHPEVVWDYRICFIAAIIADENLSDKLRHTCSQIRLCLSMFYI